MERPSAEAPRRRRWGPPVADLPVAMNRPAEAAPGTGRESTDDARLADRRTATSRDGSASTREGPATTTAPQSSARPAGEPLESTTASREKRRRRSRWEAPEEADAVEASPSDRRDRAVDVVPTSRATDDARRSDVSVARDKESDARTRDASPAGLLLLPGGVLAKLPVSFLCERDAPAGADEATRDAFAALARINRAALRGTPPPRRLPARTSAGRTTTREDETEDVNVNVNVNVNERVPSRSPSPEPTYDRDGARVNTRTARAARRCEAARREALETVARLCPFFRFPESYARPRKTRKIFVPTETHPGYNFFGLIVGPRGNTQKQMQSEFGVKIVIRGRGSQRQSRFETDPARAALGEEEPMHVLVTGDDDAAVDAAAAAVARLLEPLRDEDNEHKRAQLRELAVLNGTLRENARRETSGDATRAVGAAALPPDLRARVAAQYEKDVRGTRGEPTGEPTGDDAAYRAFLAEVGVETVPETGPPRGAPFSGGEGGAPDDGASNGVSSVAARHDRRKAYVGRLPPFATEHTVRLTFAPFGAIEKIEVPPDREKNAPCRGFAFVLFAEETAARAAATYFARAASAFPHPPPPGFARADRAMDVRVKADPRLSRPKPSAPRESESADPRTRLYVAGLAPSFSGAALRSLVVASLTSANAADANAADANAADANATGDLAIVSCDVVVDRTTGLGRGFAFVRTRDARVAARVAAALDGAEVEGRRIVVRVAEERRANERHGTFEVRAPRGGAYGFHDPHDPFAQQGVYANPYAHYDPRAVAAAEAAVAAANPALAAAAAAEMAAFATEGPGAYYFAPPAPPAPNSAP